MAEYLVRAGLEFRFSFKHRDGMEHLQRQRELPTWIGGFELNDSPNCIFYLPEIDWLEYERASQQGPNWEFPVSLLYLEGKVRVPDNGNARARADEVLESLECLLRLFQPGGVSVRRHSNYMPRVVGQELKRTIFFPGVPVKPETATLHERAPYPLDDEVLGQFIEFFDAHWEILQENTPGYLAISLTRFNSSYERRSQADRLVDLVISLEAMFGDRKSRSISHKVATRCADWLHSLEDERLTACDFVKKMYKERNNVVHGEQEPGPCKTQVDELEDVVRASLRKFLDYRASTGKIPHGNDLDNLILTGKT